MFSQTHTRCLKQLYAYYILKVTQLQVILGSFKQAQSSVLSLSKTTHAVSECPEHKNP
jgi:hypothetical protein